MGEGMGTMMGSGMGAMMGEGMGAMMGGGMGSMMNMSHGVVAGAAVTAGATGTVGKIIRHPVVLIGLGVAFGYLLHKYRKQIISWAGE